MARNNPLNASGFALVEAVLVLLVVAAFVGIGGYVVHRSRQAHTVASTTATPNQSKAPSVQPNGTSASITALTQQDAQKEAGADSSADSQSQQTSTSANGAISNVGGAYNENSL